MILCPLAWHKRAAKILGQSFLSFFLVERFLLFKRLFLFLTNSLLVPHAFVRKQTKTKKSKRNNFSTAPPPTSQRAHFYTQPTDNKQTTTKRFRSKLALSKCRAPPLGNNTLALLSMPAEAAFRKRCCNVNSNVAQTRRGDDVVGMLGVVSHQVTVVCCSCDMPLFFSPHKKKKKTDTRQNKYASTPRCCCAIYNYAHINSVGST